MLKRKVLKEWQFNNKPLKKKVNSCCDNLWCLAFLDIVSPKMAFTTFLFAQKCHSLWYEVDCYINMHRKHGCWSKVWSKSAMLMPKQLGYDVKSLLWVPLKKYKSNTWLSEIKGILQKKNFSMVLYLFLLPIRWGEKHKKIQKLLLYLYLYAHLGLALWHTVHDFSEAFN
jgi:hypothetical protein